MTTPAAIKKDYTQQYNGQVLKNAGIDRAYLCLRGESESEAASADATLVARILDLCQMTLDFPVTEACIRQRLATIAENRVKLQQLRRIPIIEQRSPEWYEARSKLVTASSLAQALGLGKFKSQREFIVEKSGYTQVPFVLMPPLIWGTKYEPVACDIYSRRNRVKVYEFGLIAHPTVSFFGASPDGITDTGVMLEIKCPYRRKTTGEIPLEYFWQMQGQLDVCDLDECDYIECSFQEYDDADSFARDAADVSEKGVLLEYRPPGAEKPSWVYGPANASPADTDAWVTRESERLYEMPGVEVVKATYWRLAEYMCKRVQRNPSFIQGKYAELEIVWNKILLYRQNRELYDREVEPSVASTSATSTTKTITIRSKKSTAPTTILDLTGGNDVVVRTDPDAAFVKYAFVKRDNDEW
jgi:putative phage-type endonuclease